METKDSMQLSCNNKYVSTQSQSSMKDEEESHDGDFQLEDQDPVWKVLSDQYEIHQTLGTGTFGVVVSATHMQTGTKVAIKLMKSSFSDNYDAKKRVSEIQILRKLSAIKDNCFTTKIFDVIFSDVKLESSDTIDYIFIVMEIEDTDLAEVLNQYDDYELKVNHISTLMYNMLCSVHYMHSANLIHRDLKPGNMLLNFECIPKLCDFGLARSMPKGMSNYTTEIGSVYGNC